MDAPDTEQLVADTLGVSNGRARALLRSNDNDPDKAIQSYHKIIVALPRPPSKPEVLEDEQPLSGSTSATPTPPSETSSSDQEDDTEEWDFILPRIPPPKPLTNGGKDGSGEFFLDELVGAIQHGESCDRVRNYLAFYGPDIIRAHMNATVAGFPAVFYVTETRNPELLRLWCKYGADVNATASSGLSEGVPLLAYAVALGGSFRNDTTDLVATLLSVGANPAVLPKAFYFPLTRDLTAEGPPTQEMPELSQINMSWCTPSVRAMITARLNFRQRYYMHMASILRTHGPRAKQVTWYKDADNLLGVPYFLIGQTPAGQFLIKRLLRHLAKPSKSPLVMVFAGPSGHGKTELARRLGELISLEMEIVDCTNKSDEKEMFGARAPYQGWENSSPLNSFLARNAGQRCIVFLDEFEKTSTGVHQTLLLPFQNGEYEDRKARQTVDCSKAIWILATNAFDDTIHEFCKNNEAALFQSEGPAASEKLVKGLCKTLRTESISQFGAPLTGRITEFVPFLTFSHTEQAAVAHKYLTELGKELAKPVVISREEEKQRFIGDIDLQVPKDYTVCRIIAHDEYVEQLGARSVINGVNRMIEGEVIDHYLEMEDEIREGQGLTTYRVQANLDDDIEDID
ncbi:hypothetical protein LA080_011061 [Diaporthe eres]|nr:hypothetical protein LA080_011061 [Diaporthe eres]